MHNSDLLLSSSYQSFILVDGFALCRIILRTENFFNLLLTYVLPGLFDLNPNLSNCLELLLTCPLSASTFDLSLNNTDPFNVRISQIILSDRQQGFETVVSRLGFCKYSYKIENSKVTNKLTFSCLYSCQYIIWNMVENGFRELSVCHHINSQL